MNHLFAETKARLDFKEIIARVRALHELEKGQTFPCYSRAAEFTASLLCNDGFSNVEVLEFPADGKTVFHDLTMPYAWDASSGSLTIPGIEADGMDPVVADYRKHPFHLIKGSCAIADKPVEVRIVRESQMLAGENVKDALILLEPMVMPRMAVIRMLLDLGAKGFITDYLRGRYETPDAFQWTTAATESGNWHVTAEDRPFIGFTISPKTGDFLREKALHIPLTGIVECDAKRYEGTFPCVTALIPGKSKREVWCIAHLFEPLADDDSLGVISAIECARQIMQDHDNYFSVRLIFSLELYGITAYAASRGGYIGDQVVGACNFDSQLCRDNGFILVTESGPGMPFCGNLLMRLLAREIEQKVSTFPKLVHTEKGAYFDDIALNDPTVGVPSVWFLGRKGERWHNCTQTPAYIEKASTLDALALNATLVKALAAPKIEWVELARSAFPARLERIRKEMKDSFSEREADGTFYLAEYEKAMFQDFSRLFPNKQFSLEIPEIKVPTTQSIVSSNWNEYAAEIVPTRKRCGFPYVQTAVPPKNRETLPDSVIYGIFANVLSGMDGKKNLAQIIHEAEYQRGVMLKENTVKSFVEKVCYLSEYGYLALENQGKITKDVIVETLKKLGIKRGDVLMIHSSVSGCGQIEGGVASLFAAFREIVGDEGTLLFPTFNRPYINLGGSTNKSYIFRPFSSQNRSDIWTGKLPRYVLDYCQEAIRSRHITHSWTGVGPLASACLSAHGAFDPPVSENSPLKKVLEFNGKIVHFGTQLSTTTFLHLFEHEFDLPGLGDAVCKLKAQDGSESFAVIQKHLPGDRDFYHNDINSRFFKAACAHGLHINSVHLQAGMVRCMELQELYQVGRKIIEKDRDIFTYRKESTK